MTDRDKFAAAALTGLLCARKFNGFDDAIVAEPYAAAAWKLADAMLAARGDTTDHHAAPAATAEAGTGDTRAAQEPVAWAAYESESDAEPIALCFKESRARDEVRGVAGSRVVPLYAAPPAAGPALTEDEREAVELSRDFCEAQGERRLADVLSGLLALAAKEPTR